MSCTLEPAIWSHDTGQRIPCFDRCQLIRAEVHGKLRLYGSVSLLFGRHVGQLRRRRRAYAPTSNTASHDNHEKINSWVSFSSYMSMHGAQLAGPSGRRSSAIILYSTIRLRARVFYEQIVNEVQPS